MVDDNVIDHMYADEEQREKDDILRKKLGDKEFEKQRYGIVEKDESDIDMSDSDNAEGDLSAEEIIEKAEEVIKMNGMVFIKFTCDFCGSRQTGATPNTFHTAGYYCQECRQLCKPRKYGLMVVFAEGPNKELTLNMIKDIIASKVDRNKKDNKKLKEDKIWQNIMEKPEQEK